MLLNTMLLLCLIAWFTSVGANDCIPRKFKESSIVCVCNSTYCDSTPEMDPATGSYLWYVSDKSGQRMNMNVGNINRKKKAHAILTLNRKKRYQKLNGFGAAFTDSAGINIKNLTKGAQEELLKTYFGKNGSRYNFGRVPIGGTDFSTRFYTYDDDYNDVSLKRFSLAEEDLDYKIPLMKTALEMNPELKFFAAPWTAPTWMKTNNNYTGFGFLKDEYYQLYADYLIKFLEEYKKYGLDFWAISTGNEPSNAYAPSVKLSTMGWTPSTVGKWIAENLGPSLFRSPSNKTMILVLDDQRMFLPWYVKLLFQNQTAKNYVSGIAVHWYWDTIIPPLVLDQTHDEFSDKFLIMSEACIGSFPWQEPKVRLGNWHRAEFYVEKIFENLNHWMTGWVDWNLALDKMGGPNWINNFVDAPIIVNPETDEFFKQPIYYVIHHFSRFLPRGSTKLELQGNFLTQEALFSIAFETTQNETVVLLYNRQEWSQAVDVVDSKNGVINLKLPPQSMNTIVYKS